MSGGKEFSCILRNGLTSRGSIRRRRVTIKLDKYRIVPAPVRSVLRTESIALKHGSYGATDKSLLFKTFYIFDRKRYTLRFLFFVTSVQTVLVDAHQSAFL